MGITGILQVVQLGGINVGFLVGIIAILGLVKTIEKKKYFGGGAYLIAVLALGLIAGFVTAGGGFIARLVNGIAHAGVASIIYQYWTRIIPAKGKVREADSFIVLKK